MTHQAKPIQPKDRIQVIDVLRGFAVFGILVMNMGVYSGTFWQDGWSGLAQWIVWLQHFLVEAKFYSLFSFLFGLGMTIQMHRAEERGTAFRPIYLRRLFFLLLIGLAHSILIWTGDILVLYALLGLLLLPFRKRSDKTILIAALVCLLLPIVISSPGLGATFRQWLEQATAPVRQTNLSGQNIYASGNYLQITAQRIYETIFMRVYLVYSFGNVFVMFLLGLYVGRRKIFQHLPGHLPFVRQVMGWSLGLGLLFNALYVFCLAQPEYIPADFGQLARRGLRTIAAPALCFFYITAIIWLYQNHTWRQRLASLAPVGRMALSNYLFQSLVATTIFYGYGLGLYGQITPLTDLVLTLIIFALQIRLSVWWLERFRFGPAEWLWRSLTYGRIQPLRVDVDEKEATPSRRKVALVAGTLALLLALGLWWSWHSISENEQTQLVKNLPGLGPTVTPMPKPRRPTPTPTPIATPVVEPVVRRPGPVAARGDLWSLGLAFDEELAFAEIEILTGPPYLGRYAGSPGGQAAGDYLAQRFAEYGLRPAGVDGTFFQPFPIFYARHTDMPRLIITRADGGQRVYQLRRDFAPIVFRYMGGGQAEGPVVWANDCAHNDFDEVNVVDKIVFCWDRLFRMRQADVGRTALEHGAAGLLLLSDPETHPFDRLVPNREIWLSQPIPTLRIAPTVAQDLLSGTGLTPNDLTVTFASFPLSTTVRLEVPLHIDDTAQGRNVLGVLPGRDPRYAGELLILGGHYDHIGEDPDGTAWVGANDNASGVAALLEIARSWQAQGYVPRRTVLFAAWDAEEIGLDGSRHYVNQPRYPLTRTVAMLQLDMVGAGEDTLYLDGDNALATKLAPIAHALGISTTMTNYGGSDHTPFNNAGVPANLLIWFGAEESPATAHYHRPLDTPNVIEPAKLAAAGRLANLALLTLAEGEPAILELLEARAGAANSGDLDAFLQTGTSAQQRVDAAWFADLQTFDSPQLALTATGWQLVGRVATATVRLELAYASGEDQTGTRSAELPVRFVHQDDGWRWDGPPLVRQQPADGFAVAHLPEHKEAAAELSRLAGQHYAQIAGQLGLPPTSRAGFILYPNHEALRADTGLSLAANTGLWIEGYDDDALTLKLVYTPQLTHTSRLIEALTKLALAEAGVPPDSVPWLWRGLPMALRHQADPLAAQAGYLPDLYEALLVKPGGQASPVTPEALDWAAVEFLRERVGWIGLGQLALALGRGASPDAALTQVVELDAAEFETAWQTTWRDRLAAAQAEMTALLAARQQAVLAGDEAAFLRTVDPNDATLLAEERAWFAGLAANPLETFSLSGQPVALLDDGGLLAGVTMQYQPANESRKRSVPLLVRFAPGDSGYHWAGPLFKEIDTNDFIIRYPAGYEPLARDLIPQIEAAYRQITADLPLEARRPFIVKLYDDPQAFHASIALAVPAWVESWTGPEQSLKLLVSALNNDDGPILARELTRHLLFQNGNRGGWLQEGLAIYESGRADQPAATQISARNLPLVIRGLKRYELFALAEPPDFYPLSEREARVAHAQSWDMVRYLVDTYGWTKLPGLLRQLEQGQDLAGVFEATYGLTLAEFETAWQESLGRGHAAPEWVDLAQTFDPLAASAHITALAGPETAGRQAGLPGETAAADYIAEQFAVYGLTPAGDEHTFFQRFPITYSVLLNAPRLLPLDDTGSPLAALRYRRDFVLVQTGAAGGGQVEAEIVWMRGEEYGPVRLSGQVVLRRPTAPLEAEIAQAIAHGAGGLILLGDRSEKEALPKTLHMGHPDSAPEKTIPVLELTPAGLERLLALTGYTLTDLNTSPPAMPLALRLRLVVPVQTQTLTSANVLGLLPGSDPKLQEEIIVVAAHYDHVGDDPDDRICLATGECVDLPGFKYPGANDDAAAVSVLLETMRLWQERGYRPGRSILFAAWGGQELGEVGSQYYVAHPTRPLTNTIAMFQLEAVAGGRGFYLQGQSEADNEGVLRFALDSAAGQVEGRLSLRKPARAGDQDSFRQMGIPAMLVYWEKAVPENLPAEFDDEVELPRLGQTGRMVSLALMMLAQ